MNDIYSIKYIVFQNYNWMEANKRLNLSLFKLYSIWPFIIGMPHRFSDGALRFNNCFEKNNKK